MLCFWESTEQTIVQLCYSNIYSRSYWCCTCETRQHEWSRQFCSSQPMIYSFFAISCIQSTFKRDCRQPTSSAKHKWFTSTCFFKYVTYLYKMWIIMLALKRVIFMTKTQTSKFHLQRTLVSYLVHLATCEYACFNCRVVFSNIVLWHLATHFRKLMKKIHIYLKIRETH